MGRDWGNSPRSPETTDPSATANHTLRFGGLVSQPFSIVRYRPKANGWDVRWTPPSSLALVAKQLLRAGRMFTPRQKCPGLVYYSW